MKSLCWMLGSCSSKALSTSELIEGGEPMLMLVAGARFVSSQCFS